MSERDPLAVPIDWEMPPPRSGLKGALDRFVGPGATRAELALQTVPVVAAALAAPLYASHVTAGWSWPHYLVCALLAFDIAGGIITNATSSAKRWYHRAGQGGRQHMGFVGLHLVHLTLVSLLFAGVGVTWGAAAGAYLLLAAGVILAVPLYLRRPVAYVTYGISLLLALYVLPEPTGLEWFLPLFYFKLLVSHLPKEEPYRPAPGS